LLDDRSLPEATKKFGGERQARVGERKDQIKRSGGP